MRKLGVLLIAVAGVFALAGVAQAAVRSVRTLTISQSSATAGASTGISIGLITKSDPAGLTPDIGGHDDIFLHKGITYNGRYYTQCNKARLLARGPSACASSQIGSGSITGLVHQCGTNPPLAQSQVVPVVLKLFNGTGGTHEYAFLTAPVIGAVVLDTSILRAPSPFGLKFVFNVPDNLVSPVPGLCASLADVRINITRRAVTVKRRVRGRTVTTHPGLIVNGPCPSNRKWRYRDDVKFVSALHTPSGTGRGEASLTCRR